MVSWAGISPQRHKAFFSMKKSEGGSEGKSEGKSTYPHAPQSLSPSGLQTCWVSGVRGSWKLIVDSWQISQWDRSPPTVRRLRTASPTGSDSESAGLVLEVRMVVLLQLKLESPSTPTNSCDNSSIILCFLSHIRRVVATRGRAFPWFSCFAVKNPLLHLLLWL